MRRDGKVKMVPFAQNKIVEDLQGAWGHYSVAMGTPNGYKNGTCLLITAAL